MSIIKEKSRSAKASLLGGAVNLVVLVIYCIYGAVYDYFDAVVFLTLALGIVCAACYALIDRRWTEVLNLLAAVSVSFGVGLFFLNSYPVWADRLNNITMYASRGTLVPVVIIMVMCFAVVIIDAVSCFTGKEWDVQ